MMSVLKKLFSTKREKKRDFSSFFRDASSEEQTWLLKDVARKANQDQRVLLEQYNKTHQKTAS